MRKLAVLLCVLVLVSIGFGKELAGHTIVVTVDRDGSAHVSEKYNLQLNYTDYETFEMIAKQTRTDLSMWQTFFADIRTTLIGDIGSLTTSASTAGAGNFGNNVIVNYDISGFSTQVDKVGRDVIFEVNESKFSFYQPGIDKFVIPWKTELQLKFDSTIKKTNIMDVTPSPSQSSMIDDQYTLIWYGSRIDNRFDVRYKVEENVGELDINAILSSTYDFFYNNPVYSAAVIVVLVLLLIYRKPIIGLIGESFGGEEEIEMPKRGV